MRALIAFLAASLTFAVPAAAGDSDDIRGRLEQWTDDFNAGRADAVCDLFSSEAISNYRGQPERNYDEICDLLKNSIADPANDFHYELEIREIIVEGDLAVVRLTWTLFISPINVTSVEPGMDIFRREADGKVADHPLPCLRGRTMTHIRRVAWRSNEPAKVRACRVRSGTRSSQPAGHRMDVGSGCVS